MRAAAPGTRDPVATRTGPPSVTIGSVVVVGSTVVVVDVVLVVEVVLVLDVLSGEVGAVEIRPEPAGQLVDQPEQRTDSGQGHREVAADQRGVEQPAVVKAGELLLRRFGCRFAVPGRCRPPGRRSR